MKTVVYLCCIICLLCSCGRKRNAQKPMTANELERKFGSGVVLIQNTFYYTLTFDTGDCLYFTGMKDGQIQGATLNENEVKPAIGYGTGFFVSNTGIIATNHHVVSSTELSADEVHTAFVNAFSSLCAQQQQLVNALNEQLGELRYAINSNQYSNTEELIIRYQNMTQQRESLQNQVEQINRLMYASYQVTQHSELGIAENNTFITNTSDFTECVQIADDAAHDLALLQLKNKQTPKNCHVFSVKENTALLQNRRRLARRSGKNVSNTNPMAVGTALFMIGFNLGPTLALTSTGIKAQVTSGTISQNADAIKLMYSVPALPGSSGSPVLDNYGQLVAINFAGVSGTQNFNYGIKASYLRQLFQRYVNQE